MCGYGRKRESGGGKCDLENGGIWGLGEAGRRSIARHSRCSLLSEAAGPLWAEQDADLETAAAGLWGLYGGWAGIRSGLKWQNLGPWCR